jgi:hypothetical protein
VTLGHFGNRVTDNNGFLFLWHTLCFLIIDKFVKSRYLTFYETVNLPVLKGGAFGEHSGQQLTKSSGVFSGNIFGTTILFPISYRNRAK